MNRITKALLVAALAAGCSVAFAGPVNVNTADAETISAELKGVGLSRAKAIVEYRKQHGPFKSPAELLNVKGIGVRTLEINRDNILLESPKSKSSK